MKLKDQNRLERLKKFWGFSPALGLQVLIVCGLALLVGCTKSQVNPHVLAKVGNHQITTEEFEAEIRWLTKNQQRVPDKQELLDQMIARELRLQKARSLGLDKDPEVRRRYESLLVGTLEEQELLPQLEALQVPRQEVEAAFQKEIARYTRPAKVRLALVVIRTDPKLNDQQLAEQESRMAEARKRALALPTGAQGFGSVAADYSDDQASRYKGGDVGWFDEGMPNYRWPKEVVSAGLALHQGAISPVIKTASGLFIVTRLDERPASVIPFEQAQPAIHRRLLAEKREQAQESYARQMQSFAPVQTYPEALARAPYPTSTMARSDNMGPPNFPGTTLSPNATPPAN